MAASWKALRATRQPMHGVVIAAEPLEDHVPLQNAIEEGYVTQYDKDNIEELGLKDGLFGPRTLTVMGDARSSKQIAYRFRFRCIALR